MGCSNELEKSIRDFVSNTTIIAVYRDDVIDIATYVTDEVLAYASENSIDISLEELVELTADEMVRTLVEDIA